MTGAWNNGKAHYRCLGKTLLGPSAQDHPRTSYLPEAHIVPPLDAWISSLFHPANLEQTVVRLAAAAGQPGLAEASRRAAAQNRLDAATKALRHYERLAGEGADPALVVSWSNRALAEQRAAQSELAELPVDLDAGPDRIREIIQALGDVPAALAAADPTDKAALYRLLDVGIVYDPATRTAEAEAGISAAKSSPSAIHNATGSCTKTSVRGGT